MLLSVAYGCVGLVPASIGLALLRTRPWAPPLETYTEALLVFEILTTRDNLSQLGFASARAEEGTYFPDSILYAGFSSANICDIKYGMREKGGGWVVLGLG